MSKRRKFIVATILVAVAILAIRFPFLQWRFRVPIFAVFSTLVSLWALKDEDFSGIEWITLLTLPAMFSLAGALVFPLLPGSFINFFLWEVTAATGLVLSFVIKLVFLALFMVGYYASLLTSNIYNVAGIRTIQLLRAAHAIGFILKLFCALSLYLVVISMHLNGWMNMGLVFIISVPLIILSLLTINLSERLEKRVVVYGVFLSFALSQVGWVLSYLPLSLSLYALTICALFYLEVGTAQLYFEEKLSLRSGREFLIFFIFIIVFLLWYIFFWSV